MTPRKKTSANKREGNKGTEYEKLVKSVFTGLPKLEGEHFRNLRIERNVKLDAITRKPDGTPVKRQIDVYWEFPSVPIMFETDLVQSLV
ncbi:MAG: hypothetical protein K2X81_18565 [Candidatus Obscuribacterales bacterium]|nr:hypothetical protein [Candidatus Obscuribacterales bacterium]